MNLKKKIGIAILVGIVASVAALSFAAAPPVAVVAEALRSAGLPVLDVTQTGGTITYRLKDSATAAQKKQAAQIAASTDVSPAACAAWESSKKKAAFDKSLSDLGYDPTKFPRMP